MKTTTQDNLPETLVQAIRHFSDPQVCHDFMVAIRWPDGEIYCPKCGCVEIGFISTRRMFKCKGCKKQFSTKVGTIFEDSPLGLDKWLPAVWLIVNCKNGISSYELARDLEVTQKSAWFMLHRIRLAMQNKTFMKLGGEGKQIEADETFIGGKARNMHATKRKLKIKGTGGMGKTVVMGILERGGEVRTKVVVNTRKGTVQHEVRQQVEYGSDLFTDALASYTGLDREYVHKVIDHAVEYVNGQIHTNGMENFWSLLKRGIKGTYVSVEPFHLFRYVDEQAFRFNKRHGDDLSRFLLTMQQIAGRRVTYKQLTGKVQDAAQQS
jgi:transposase-like protein